MQNLELLMPAGSQNKMGLAIDYGADAVYLGPPLYSLRARENEFKKEKIKESIDYAHSKNKKVYLTLNIFARNRKLKPFSEDVVDYAAMKPDAFIISDPSFGSIARELAPEIPIHLSVQANCMNWRSVKFWKDTLQIERVILSRELSIVEIADIKQKVPDVELEAFVHGSICIAYSGRCLLSSYMDNRDANQGVCDNSCREKYKLSSAEYYVEDALNHPGKQYQIDEDEHGTYIMNAKDLCMIEHLQKLAEAGVVSFKVEGRTKSEFYSAMVARSYRGALDDLMQGKPFNSYWLEELHKLTNRGFHTAFMFAQPLAEGQNYDSSSCYNDKTKFVGLVKESVSDNEVVAEIKNKLQLGQRVKVLSPSGKEDSAEVIRITSKTGAEKQEVHSGSGAFHLHLKGHHKIPQRSLLITHE